MFYLSKVFGSKLQKEKALKQNEAVANCVKICEKFKFFA